MKKFVAFNNSCSLAPPNSDTCTTNHSSQEAGDQVELDDMNNNYIKGNDNGNRVSEGDYKDPSLRLKEMKINNINNRALEYINVNSIRNKHADLFTIVNLNVDILTIAETKLDSSFPVVQFTVDGYGERYCKDKNANGDGLLVYAKEDIPSREINSHPQTSKSSDVIVVELNFRKCKWLLINTYKPPSINNTIFCEEMSGLVDFYSQNYKNIVIMGDFNMQTDSSNFRTFYESHELYNLVKSKTCFKSNNGTCIDLILTNQKYSFKNTCTIETGVSDFHRMIYTQLKLMYQKLPLKTIEFRDYRHFKQDEFEQDLMQALCNNPQVNFSYDQFAKTFQNTLDRHAPLKKKVIRGNQKPFMNRQLRHAIMRRSRLRNVFN